MRRKTGTDQIGTSRSEIDAGVVFADEASYLCVPLSRFGISSSTEVQSVRTSCDCTPPPIVQFCDSTGKMERALRLDFAVELASDCANPTSSNLAFEVRYQLGGCDRRSAG